jgi:hypothetical protein
MKGLVPKERLVDNLREHPAVQAWAQVQSEFLVPKQIEVLRRATKSMIYRLSGAGPDASNVIAKRCLRQGARVEQMVYQQILQSFPLPVLHCYGMLEDHDVGYCWLFLEDAGTCVYDNAVREHRQVVAIWLAALHQLQLEQTLTENLPDRGPGHYREVLHSARRLLGGNESNPYLTRADVDLLRSLGVQLHILEERWETLEQLCEAAPRALVHGDLVTKNVRVRPTDSGLAFFAFDWENAGWGPPAADLASSASRTVNPDLDIYSAQFQRKPAVTAHALAECGKIFRLLDSIQWAGSSLALISSPEWLETPMSFLRVYQVRLGEIFCERQWHSPRYSFSYGAVPGTVNS